MKKRQKEFLIYRICFILKPGARTETSDLSENTLVVDISDALSERDKVKFTVHTKVIVCFQMFVLLKR
jgi:hypothetical protein